MLDVDGVLGDIVSHVLDFVYDETGDRHDPSEVTQWDVLKSIGKKHLNKQWVEQITDHGFCSSIPVYPGAKKAVKRLERMGDVYIVTAPFDAPSWVYERYHWLKKYFDIGDDRVVNTKCKYIVEGDVFIDDDAYNVNTWRVHHPGGLAILWETSYSKSPAYDDIVVTNDWQRVYDLIKEKFGDR